MSIDSFFNFNLIACIACFQYEIHRIYTHCTGGLGHKPSKKLKIRWLFDEPGQVFVIPSKKLKNRW